MIEKFLEQTEFESLEDFNANFKIKVPENFNFAYDVVDEWARTNPTKRAICWTNDKGAHIDITFDELRHHSNITAYYFQKFGIKKGDRVMLILKRRFEFWFSIIALHKLGAVCIPATHLLTKKDIIYRCNAAGIKMIVAVDDDCVVSEIEAARTESPTLEYLVAVGNNCPDGWQDFHEGVRRSKTFVRPKHANTNDDISILYFTSGTTGNPKMVAHDFTYPLGHIVTAKYWHNLNEDSIHFTVADTGWGKAVWGKLYGQMIVGATIFVYDHEKFVAAEILAMIEKYRITSFCAPPTIYRFMIKEDLTKYDLSSLKYATIAGEPLSPTVFNAFYQATGVKPMEGFGQTETTVIIANFPWMEPKPGSMGKPNPAYDLDIITADGRSTEAGEQGEIVVYTKNGKPLGLFHGYFRDKDNQLTKQVYSDNIYHTGDVAWRDEEGYFWFVGRTDDVIKSSGYRIGPFEVESALMAHPAVLECAITGVPDEIRGQVVKATIVLTKEYLNADKSTLIKDIQDHVKHVTAPYKYPRIIDFVEELPKTISGKIRRSAIRETKK